MDTNKWLMPSYYKHFKCKCSACRHTCCHGWQIPLSKDEYFKIVSLDCDFELRHKLDISFIEPQIVDDERYRIISFNYLGDCPIQKDGLCQLHATMGEDNLPKICRLYPRSLKRINGINIACCSSSCEAVIEMLLNKDSFKMVEDYLEAKPSLEYNISSDVIKQLNHFEDIMKDRSTSLKDSIIEICLEVNEEEFRKDYNSDINPISDGLYLLNRLKGHDFLSEIIDQINDRYKNNYFQYELDSKYFEQLYPDWMYYFENVLNNSLLFENFPFVDQRCDKTLAYKGLCASYGLLRLVCIGYSATHNKKDDLVDCISGLFHLIDHTSFYYNINVLEKSAALLLKL